MSQGIEMGGTTTRYTWTYADYARLPDDGDRYEVIDGELLVTPSPSPYHQHIEATLLVALRQYVEREMLGVVLAQVDVLFASGQFLRPDIVFVPNASRDGITNRGIEAPPGLVVEILSPTSGAIDRVKKPTRYGDFGIPEYWVVDPEERCVRVWRFGEGAAEPERVTDWVRWAPAGASQPFEMAVEDMLREI